MSFQTPITIEKALSRILSNTYVLPAIQREFVWQTDQITRLFDSLMQGYPIGSFLFWKVDQSHCHDYVFYEFMRNYHQKTSRHLKRLDLGSGRDIVAILDGQQRLTALNVGLQGSHATKLPRKWVDNSSAYPVRNLYLNLIGTADENDLGMDYDFRFLTKERANSANNQTEHWYSVHEVLTLEAGHGVFDYVQENELLTSKFAFKALSRLHEVVHKDQIINFFEEESQDLDKVLNIFIRVNSGGTTLSYSDLLLSIATAQWKEVEAREVIHGLVDELNETGQGFSFNKDLILKSGLALIGSQSIAFRVTNFNATNMSALESQWNAIARSLRLAAQLLSDFGFSERTLTADSVMIPVAYYIHKRGLGDSYLTNDKFQIDREAVRTWVIRSLLKPGVWGSGLDTLLLSLRSVLNEHGDHGFPTAELEMSMLRLGKSLRFDEDELQDLVSIAYQDKRTFSLLSLLYPGMNFRYEFHIDHVFPKSRLNKRALLEAGYAESAVEETTSRGNQFPNLQLLEGPINTSKQDKLPAEWIHTHIPNDQARETYLDRHDLRDMPLDVEEFNEFFTARQARMANRLRPILGIGSS